MPFKILLWDLESSYNSGYFFDVWETNIDHFNIDVPSFIHCLSYRWYGESKIHTISILDDPRRFKKDIHDDYYVLKEFSKIIAEADMQVAHNGDRFDIKKFNERLLLRGLPPLPNIKSYDTLKIARRYFKLDYNSLDYLGKTLGYKGKMDNPKGLWRDCFNGDKKALLHLARYNRQDIE